MVLLSGLPFSFIENRQLQLLCPLAGTRQNLSVLCSRVAEDVRRNIKCHLQPGGNIIWVTIDEWTDKNSQLYLGVNAFIKTRANNIEQVCLAHQPLSAISNDALYIAGILQEMFDNYFPRSKIEGLVTDTTNLMPAIAHQLNIKWRPCYCHIINLLMQSFVQSLYNKLDLLFVIQRTLGSSTIFHNYIVQQNATVTSLPSYTETRWYSLYKLIKNVLTLQPHIQAFLTNHRYDSIGVPNNEFFNNLSKLLIVFGTAKNMMMHLESDNFGTLSKVIDAFRLIQHSVQCLPDDQFAYEKEKFDLQFTERWIDHFFNNEYHDELLLASRLNPYQLQHTSLTSEEINSANAILSREIQNMQQNANVQNNNNAGNERNENLFQNGFTFQHFREIRNNEESELERYESIIRSLQYTEQQPNLLQFWLFHMESLPHLAKIALHILLQPASSAASERVFSKAKRILVVYAKG